MFMKSWQIAVAAGVLLIAVGVGAVLYMHQSTPAAATVNGVAIPESDVEQQLAIIKDQQKDLFEGAAGKENEKRYREQILSFLINAELVKQEAERVGIKVPDKEVAQRLKQVKDLFPKKADFEKALKDQGLTEDELSGKIREQIVADKMMERVTKDVKISESDKKKYYEENRSQFAEPEQRHWRQIVSKTEKDAQDIKDQLDGGADFAELATKKSIDEQSAKQGGDIGLSSLSDFGPEISNDLKDLKLNEVSKVIKDGNGRFVVFRLEGINEGRQMKYDEVADQIEQILLRNAQQAKFSELMNRLNKEAKIEKS
jgi:parvulin-like peptidyl-prolyl isomerase